MLCETDIVVSWRARPRGFIALMSLYESNYLRFLQIAGNPASLRGTLLSHVPGDCDLLLTVLAHRPYTSALTLTYVLPGEDGASERVPYMKLLIYHDARLLEAEEWRVDHKAGAAGTRQAPRERELEQRWRRNIMLNKWLEYCAERGHRFIR